MRFGKVFLMLLVGLLVFLGNINLGFALGEGTYIKNTIEINGDTENSLPFAGKNVEYGSSVANMGDIDGDGVNDIAVGLPNNGGKGAVYIHFLNKDGTVKSTSRLDNRTVNGHNYSTGDEYGRSVRNVGDMDSNGVDDIVVGTTSGSYIHYLYDDASIKETKVSDLVFIQVIETSPYGDIVASLGDIDGNGVDDLVIGNPENGGKIIIYLLVCDEVAQLLGICNITEEYKVDLSKDLELYYDPENIYNINDTEIEPGQAEFVTSIDVKTKKRNALIHKVIFETDNLDIGTLRSASLYLDGKLIKTSSKYSDYSYSGYSNSDSSIYIILYFNEKVYIPVEGGTFQLKLHSRDNVSNEVKYAKIVSVDFYGGFGEYTNKFLSFDSKNINILSGYSGTGGLEDAINLKTDLIVSYNSGSLYNLNKKVIHEGEEVFIGSINLKAISDNIKLENIRFYASGILENAIEDISLYINDKLISSNFYFERSFFEKGSYIYIDFNEYINISTIGDKLDIKIKVKDEIFEDNLNVKIDSLYFKAKTYHDFDNGSKTYYIEFNEFDILAGSSSGSSEEEPEISTKVNPIPLLDITVIRGTKDVVGLSFEVEGDKNSDISIKEFIINIKNYIGSGATYNDITDIKLYKGSVSDSNLYDIESGLFIDNKGDIVFDDFSSFNISANTKETFIVTFSIDEDISTISNSPFKASLISIDVRDEFNDDIIIPNLPLNSFRNVTVVNNGKIDSIVLNPDREENKDDKVIIGGTGTFEKIVSYDINVMNEDIDVETVTFTLTGATNLKNSIINASLYLDDNLVDVNTNSDITDNSIKFKNVTSLNLPVSRISNLSLNISTFYIGDGSIGEPQSGVTVTNIVFEDAEGLESGIDLLSSDIVSYTGGKSKSFDIVKEIDSGGGDSNTGVLDNIVTQGYISPSNEIDSMTEALRYKPNIINAEYFNINDSGTLILLDKGTYGDGGYSVQNIQRLKETGSDIYVNVTGFRAAVTEFARSWRKRVEVAEELTKFVNDNGLDGVEINIEYFSSWTVLETDAYTSFLYELGKRLHANGKKLSIAIPAVASEKEADWYNLRYDYLNSTGEYGLAGLIDNYSIMTYGYMYDYGVGSPVQNLNWVGRVIDYAKTKFSSNKITVGMNSYGYTGVKGSYNPTIKSYDSLKHIDGFSTAIRDEASGEMYWDNGNNHYRYVDIEGMNIKKDYILNKGINKTSIRNFGGNKWFY